MFPVLARDKKRDKKNTAFLSPIRTDDLMLSSVILIRI